jgi:hypothetical protein
MPEPRYSAEEASRKARELYDAQIRAAVEGVHHGKYLVLDIETGEYLIGDDYRPLTEQLHRRRSDAQLFTMRVGFRAAGKMRRRAASR